MSFVKVTKEGEIAIVNLCRGKVNALNEPMVEEIHEELARIEEDETLRAVILRGEGKFFTFGFDIPEFLSYSMESFSRYLDKFTKLHAYLFLYPKPVIAALNGHTMAGGGMLASACDYRLMVKGKAKISLNEINFGSSVFAGSVEILKYAVGCKNAEAILYSGKMYSAEEAVDLGLVHQAVSEEEFLPEAMRVAKDFAGKDPAAFKSIKKLLRGPVVEEIHRREKASIEEFLGIWYSEKTWKNLQGIGIS